MAVINAYTDSLAAAGKKAEPGNLAPGTMFGLACTFEVGAADSAASIYRIANVNANLIPVWMKLASDSAIQITSLNVGLYEPGANGAVVDYDCLAATINPTAGYIIGCLLYTSPSPRD